VQILSYLRQFVFLSSLDDFTTEKENPKKKRKEDKRKAEKLVLLIRLKKKVNYKPLVKPIRKETKTPNKLSRQVSCQAIVRRSRR